MHTFSEKDSKLPDSLKSQKCIFFEDKTILFFKLFRVGVKPRNLSNLLVRAPITISSCFVGFKIKNHRVIKSTCYRLAQSGIVNRVSKLESKPLLVNVAILVILWLYLRHGTIGNSVFAIKLTMPKNSWQSFKFLLITHHSLILKYFHLYKVISNHFPNVFYL